MKDSSGRPGPAVIRAICPQPTRGMGLANSLMMTYPSPRQLPWLSWGHRRPCGGGGRVVRWEREILSLFQPLQNRRAVRFGVDLGRSDVMAAWLSCYEAWARHTPSRGPPAPSSAQLGHQALPQSGVKLGKTRDGNATLPARQPWRRRVVNLAWLTPDSPDQQVHVLGAGPCM